MNDRAPLSGDVFIVDDNPVNIRRLSEVLKPAGAQIRAATTGARALEALRAQPADVVLLDVELPDSSGFAICEALLTDAGTRGLRVVFVTAHDSPLERSRAFRAGGADWMSKPFSDEEVLARVGTQLELARLAKENEALRRELGRSDR